MNSGQNAVRPSITNAEIRSAVNRGSIQGAPKAAGDIPVVPNGGSLNDRINIRGQITSTRGKFGDGVIGATALERGSTLVSRDKQLRNAVNKLGGCAVATIGGGC